MGRGNRGGLDERTRVAERVRALLGEAEDAYDDGRLDAGHPDAAHKASAALEGGGLDGDDVALRLAPHRGGWVPEDDEVEWPPDRAFGPGRASRADPLDEDAAGPSARLRELVTGWRLDPGRRAARALALVVAVVVAGCAWWFSSTHGQVDPVASTPSAAAAGTGLTAPATGWPSSAAGGAASGTSVPLPLGAPGASVAAGAGSTSTVAPVVVVDVAGRVRRPGVYRLPNGSRVGDALRAAGGARPHTATTALNLAAVLADGEQIVVGGPAAGIGPPQGAATAAPVAGSTGTGALVNLNTATSDELQVLPGVGPATAQKILDWRAAHGSFTSVDQLDDVSGIGPVTLGQLRPLVTV